MKNLLFLILLGSSLALQAQKKMNNFTINDEVVAPATIAQIEAAYRVKCVPGNYWYDRFTGAFGLKGGPCTGIGVAGLNIGGQLKANASGGGTGIFINGRELHPVDVANLQAFMQPQQGRYWMDAYGNFGCENYPFALGNVYSLYQQRFGKSSYYKNNVWSGESTSFGSDGSFMYYSSKKSDGTTYEYFRD